MFAELRHLDGACAGQTRIIRKDFATIGRHDSADLRFDPERDLDVSGRHAALFRAGTDWMVRDLGSSNGTWVNGTRIKGDRLLRPDDVIRFGSGGPQLLFVGQHEEAAATPHTEAVTVPVRARQSTTERIRVEVARQTAPWRRVVVGAGALAFLAGVGLVLMMQRRGRQVEAERTALLARTDTLMGRLQAASSSVTALEAALRAAQQDTRRLRASLAEEGVSSERLDSLSRALTGSVAQHEAVLRAAQLDAAAIERANGDAIGVIVSEFPGGHRVAGTGFAVRVRGDTGWIVTSRHLVREAGGVVTNVDGSPYDPYTPDALASNGPLHPALLAAFASSS